MKSGVYKITNLITNKNYIGVSVHIEQRQEEHKKGKGNKELFKDFIFYGLINFSFEIIEECSKEKFNEREPYQIKYYNAYTNGYNKNPGGIEGNLQAIEVTKKEIYCYDLNGNFIKKYDSLSDAERELKISNSNISRAAKTNGRTLQYQQRYNYEEKILPYKRKCFTGRQTQGNIIKKVKQYDKNFNYIATYDSITLAAEKTGANATCIGEICKTKGLGKRKTSGGYIQRYAEDNI